VAQHRDQHGVVVVAQLYSTVAVGHQEAAWVTSLQRDRIANTNQHRHRTYYSTQRDLMYVTKSIDA
jgi:hypothetical protein